MLSKLVGDILIKGRDKDMNERMIKVTNMFIDPKSKYTILSATKVHKVGRFEIIQRGSVHMLANMNSDKIVFDKVYETRSGYLVSCENKLIWNKIII